MNISKFAGRNIPVYLFISLKSGNIWNCPVSCPIIGTVHPDKACVYVRRVEGYIPLIYPPSNSSAKEKEARTFRAYVESVDCRVRHVTKKSSLPILPLFPKKLFEPLEYNIRESCCCRFSTIWAMTMLSPDNSFPKAIITKDG